MRYFTSLLFTTAISTLASAQYTIDPDSVDITTRDSWCSSQTSACPLICSQTSAKSDDTDANTCDPTTLTFSCICGNGISPNASQYSETLPYFICTQWGTDCVANCGSNSTCSYNCRANHPCGAQDPVRVNTSTVTSTMSKTASSTVAGATTNTAGQTVYTGFGGSAATSASSSSGKSSSGAVALELGQAYGLIMVAAGLFGGFALLL